jgi:WhiB family redox-sensing transcriptional regulator
VTSWKDDAVCAQTDPELFFPHPGETAAKAKAICARCPVVDKCLAYGLQINDQHAIYGGLTVRERRALKRAAA